MAAGKKPGSNNKSSCGSGAKAKKGDQTGDGHVLPGSMDELRKMAQDAQKKGDTSRAEHLFTMAINAAAKGMKRNQDGVASDTDLRACEKSNEGKLSQLLVERAQVYLRQGKTASAIEDAETCTRADQRCEDGYRLLLQGYEAVGAPLQVQLEACERGITELESCEGGVSSEYLVKAKWRLKKAINEKLDSQDAVATDAQTAVKETQRLADDVSDPRHVTAAADWGSILATGAHGVDKDLQQAERYLRRGADRGDVIAQRNLGLLLLELDRPGEASQELNKAAVAGDEQAAEMLRYLSHEADIKRKEAMEKLEELAAQGHPQARAMLEELRAQ